MKKIFLSLAILLAGTLIFLLRAHPLGESHLDLASQEQDPLQLLLNIQRGQAKVNSVEEFINLLPASLKKSHVFIYASRSLQESSFEYPRALLISRDARQMVTFNGQSAQRGYQAVESIFYDEATASYRLFELNFASGSPKVTENPTQCLSCHGERPKPIWDPYPLWPGVYGSEDDCEFADASKAKVPAPCLPQALEAEHYQKFMQGNRHQGRYALLPDLDPRAFIDGQGIQRPLLGVSRKLMARNEERIATQLAADGKLKNIRALIWALFSGPFAAKPFRVIDLLPPELRQSFVTYVRLRAQALNHERVLGLEHRFLRQMQLMKGQFQSERLARRRGGSEYYSLVQEPNGLKKFEDVFTFDMDGKYIPAENSSLTQFYVLMELMDQHPENWSLTPYPRYFSDDVGQFQESGPQGFYSILKKSFFPQGEPEDLQEKVADEIKNFSPILRRQLEEKTKSPPFSPLPLRLAEEAFQRVCTRCHLQGTALIPALDFSRTSSLWQQPKFRTEISKRIRSTDPDEKMPQDEILTETEKNAILWYVEKAGKIKSQSDH